MIKWESPRLRMGVTQIGVQPSVQPLTVQLRVAYLNSLCLCFLSYKWEQWCLHVKHYNDMRNYHIIVFKFLFLKLVRLLVRQPPLSRPGKTIFILFHPVFWAQVHRCESIFLSRWHVTNCPSMGLFLKLFSTLLLAPILFSSPPKFFRSSTGYTYL